MTFYDVVQCPVEFDTNRGKVRILDGMAAGGSWLLVEFLEGELKGKKLWMNNDEKDAQYFANCSDDGMLFNPNPNESHEDKDVVDGGEYLPELERLQIWIKEN